MPLTERHFLWLLIVIQVDAARYVQQLHKCSATRLSSICFSSIRLDVGKLHQLGVFGHVGAHHLRQAFGALRRWGTSGF